MKLKPGTSTVGLKGCTTLAMLIVDGVVLRELGHEATFTRVTERVEGEVEGSLHPEGYAFDLRTWDVCEPDGTQLPDEVKQRLAKAIQYELGPEWQVLVFDKLIHVECEAAKARLLSERSNDAQIQPAEFLIRIDGEGLGIHLETCFSRILDEIRSNR